MHAFDAAPLVRSLDAFPALLDAAVAGLSDAEIRFRPDERRWSILAICRHLLDEEREDFRVRVFMTLETPEAPWPGIDPEGAAVARRYEEGELTATLAAFGAERFVSVAQLRALRDADWSRTHVHPRFGPIRAGDLLAAWADHDLLHLRQIVKRRHELVVRAAQPWSTDYAGAWTA